MLKKTLSRYWIFTIVAGLASCHLQQNMLTEPTKIPHKLKHELTSLSTSTDSVVAAEAKGFLTVFDGHYFSYRPDTAAIASLAKWFLIAPNCRVEVYGGNWCSDTHEGIPALAKVLDQSGFDPGRFYYHWVSRDKLQVDGVQQAESIGSVPLVKLFNGDRFLGSIVEFPRKSWEADLLTLLQSMVLN